MLWPVLLWDPESSVIGRPFGTQPRDLVVVWHGLARYLEWIVCAVLGLPGLFGLVRPGLFAPLLRLCVLALLGLVVLLLRLYELALLLDSMWNC